MFLLVLAYPGCPGSKAVKRSLLLLLLYHLRFNVSIEAVCLCVQGGWLEQCVNTEPEVLWIDTDKLLHTPQWSQQRGDVVFNELEAQLVVCIVHRLVEVRERSQQQSFVFSKVFLPFTILGNVFYCFVTLVTSSFSIICLRC